MVRNLNDRIVLQRICSLCLYLSNYLEHPMLLPYAVYILKCANGKHYTGYTSNITKRLIAHRKGEVSFTNDKLHVELVHLSLFANKQKAYDFERYLKSGSGIAFRNKRFI